MATVTLSEMEKAAARVGSDEQQQLEWALRLIYEDVKSWGAGRWRDLQVELGIFRGAGNLLRGAGNILSLFRKGGKLPLRHPIFPDEEETKKIHKWFVDSFARYSASNEILIRWKGPTDFTLRAGHFGFGVGDPLYSCCIKLMSLVGKFSSHVHQCQQCTHWFLGKKTDQTFCSKRCAAYKRTTEFRARQRKVGK